MKLEIQVYITNILSTHPLTERRNLLGRERIVQRIGTV